MSPNAYVLAGFLIGLGLLVVAWTVRARIAGRSDAESWRRIEQRLVEINGSSNAGDRGPASASANPTPRARLARDTSVVLVAFGSVLVVAQALADLGASRGDVLELTGRPALAAPAGSTASDDRSTARASSSRPVATPAARPSPSRPALTSGADPSLGSERIDALPADRLALLRPCPDEPGCSLYVVRQGDNLVSIAAWFGVPYETVLAVNSQLADPSRLGAGDVIRLPVPSR
jgi:hypothetical protein